MSDPPGRSDPLEPLPPPHAELKAVPWRAWEGLVIWVPALLVAGVVAVLVAGGADCRKEDLEANARAACDNSLWASLLVNEAVLAVLTLFWVGVRYGANAADLGLRAPSRADVSAGLRAAALGLVGAYGVTAVAISIWRLVTPGDVDLPEQVDLKATEPSAIFLALLGVVVVIVAPIAEELFFRGFVYRGLRRWAAPVAATLISAVAFGLAHIQPLFILPTFVLGIVLARVAERQGSIAPAIVAHMLFNLIGFALLVQSNAF